ncbi:MAG: FG-GAP-like repeat-containing protein [Bacteroidia bacterium]
MKTTKLRFAIAFLAVCFVSPPFLSAQGGWVKNTDPVNAVNQYTCVQSYAGAAFIDINQDGYVDIFAAPRTYFLNDSTGFFPTLYTLPFSPLNAACGVSFADLNNDSLPDCVVAAVQSKVFFNLGATGFADSSSKVPVFTNYASFGCAIGNLDNDDKPDFVFAHANGFHPNPTPCKLYVQKPNGFNPVRITDYTFTNTLAPYTNPYWSDYDLDGDMDLFIASGPVTGTPLPDYCYRNMLVETGKDTLIRMVSEKFAADNQDGQCYNFIDYDNDGDLDLCLTNYFSAPTRFYRNDGGVYTSLFFPFTNATTNLASCWGDYDNDGDLDVIITNDNQATRYYRNDGNGGFSFLNNINGFSTFRTNTVVNGDVDNDGDLDLFVHGLGNGGSTATCGLYINDTVAGNRNWVNISLTGGPSNYSAIGAIVRIKAIIRGQSVWQMREVNAQNTFQGQNDLRVHFGLDDATVIDAIVIRWPSGNVDTHVNFPANQFYHLSEGRGADGLERNLKKPVALKIYPNPADRIIRIDLPFTITRPVAYSITDIDGKVVQSGRIAQNDREIELSEMVSGNYFLTVTTADGTFTGNFVRR